MTPDALSAFLGVHPGAGFESTLHALLRRFPFPVERLKKLLEWSRIYTSTCAVPSLLCTRRSVLDWVLLLFVLFEDDRKSYSRSHPGHMAMRRQAIDRVRSPLQSEPLDLSAAVGAIARFHLLAAGYAERHIARVAGILSHVLKSLADTPSRFESFEQFMRHRRHSIGVEWWSRTQAALLELDRSRLDLEPPVLQAMSDAIILSNDARSRQRDRAEGVANVFDFVDQTEFLSLLRARFERLHGAIDRRGPSIVAEVVAASVAGCCATYALMERYAGWRYASASPFLLELREYEREECLKLTQSVMPRLHQVLRGWGSPASFDHLHWPVAGGQDAIGDEQAISAVDQSSGRLLSPTADELVLARAEAAWWLGNSPRLQHLAAARTSLWAWSQGIGSICTRDLRTCAALGSLGSAPHVAQLHQDLWREGVALDDIPPVALSEALRVFLETSGEASPRCAVLRDHLLHRLKEPCAAPRPLDSAPRWSFRASVARTLARFPRSTFLAPLQDALRKATLRAAADETTGVGHVHATADRAFTKLVVGASADGERRALDSVLSCVGVVFEPIHSTPSTGRTLTADGWTTLVATAAVQGGGSGDLVSPLR